MRATGRRSAAILVLAAIVLVVGWKTFWFLTDDAHIAFRYVSNSVLGHGYVWNAPPFLPVEGYTSFLWVLLLDGTWRLTGISPPRSANVLSLVTSFLTLVLTTRFVLRLRLAEHLDARRGWLLILVLLGITTNRTFLAWTSSGLETAMFNFFGLLWVYSFLGRDDGAPRTWSLRTLSSALVYLTRPDGLLFVLVTLLLVGISVGSEAVRRRFDASSLRGGAPLLLVVLHLGWRRLTYGEWLPNTYTAKYTGPWPESGIRYLLSFVLEYALWLWLLLVVLAVGAAVGRRLGGDRAPGAWSSTFEARARPTLVVLTLVAHVAYYTYVIGGDHFEYRVYSHLVPLVFISFLWLANSLGWSARRLVVSLAGFVLLSYPLPWIHWAKSQPLQTRDETKGMKVSVAESLPSPFRWYGRWFDSLQFWLMEHSVGLRHQEHKIFYRFQRDRFPAREEGESISGEDLPVFVRGTVGVPGWVLPHVNVIDKLGLNDYVVARMPVDPNAPRRMAHERRPPDGYLESYYPNVELAPEGGIVVSPRPFPISAEYIEIQERDWRRRIARIARMAP